MADKTERLVLVGGVDLGFRDGTGAKRRAVRDEPFEVDAATAAILLTDPNVQRVGDAPRPTVVPTTPAASTPAQPTKAELLARATELELEVPNRATNAAIAEAIAAEEARREAEAAATAAIADAATATTGESDESGDSTGGAITLGDLPAGAKVGAG